MAEPFFDRPRLQVGHFRNRRRPHRIAVLAEFKTTRTVARLRGVDFAFVRKHTAYR